MSIELLPLPLAALLTLAALFGAFRAVRNAPRRRALRVVAQFVLAAAVAAVLAWPAAESEDAMIVLTQGDVGARPVGDRHSQRIVALPGATAPGDVERAPDLATALRRHPGTRTLEIRGNGLPVRDRDAARGLALRFDAPAPPNGIVELHAAARVREGREWSLRGRTRGVEGGSVELLGPGDVLLERATLAEDGRFTIATFPKVAGPLDATLRLLDRDGSERDRAPLPVLVEPGATLRIAVVAGAPSPELKYLRRWARDAGHSLRTRMALSPGIALRDAPFVLEAATLAGLDLVIVDERAFTALAPRERDALDEAVRGGLGLLLRATGPVPADVAQAWAALGWRIEGTGNALPAQLPGMPPAATGPRRFERADVKFTAGDSAPLLVARDHVALARWRAHGRGRVGTWTLVDAYRLALAGEAPRFGSLWAGAIETLARAQGSGTPRVPHDARVGERAVVCGIRASAHIEAPDGTTQPLLADGTKCAALWPSAPGWHALVDGESREPFAVVAADAGANVQASERRAATRALARVTSSASEEPTPFDWRTRAAWALIALFAVAWWSERRA